MIEFFGTVTFYATAILSPPGAPMPLVGSGFGRAGRIRSDHTQPGSALAAELRVRSTGAARHAAFRHELPGQGRDEPGQLVGHAARRRHPPRRIRPRHRELCPQHGLVPGAARLHHEPGLVPRVQPPPARSNGPLAAEIERTIVVCANATLFFVGLCLGIGPPMVDIIYSAKWLPAFPALYVYSLAIAIGFLSSIVASALDALGRPKSCSGCP